MNLIEAMKIAEGVFAQYKIDQLKWWKRLDGTPMLNDLAVLFSLAFMEASTEKKDSTHRCKVGRVCDPETCTRALTEDKPNVSTSTNSSAPADVAAVRDAVLEEVLTALGDLSFECFASIGTARPSVETYNRTFSVLEKYRALKSAATTAQPQADGVVK